MNGLDLFSSAQATALAKPSAQAQKNYVDASLDLHGYTFDDQTRQGIYQAFAMTVDAIAPMLAAPLPYEVEPASPYHLKSE